MRDAKRQKSMTHIQKKNGTIEIAFVGSKILTGPRYRQRLQNSSYKYVKIMNGHFA